MRMVYRGYVYEAASSNDLLRWFGSSVVVDESGNPLVCYRGEHGLSDSDLHSRFTALSFTPSQELAELYATEPNNSSDRVEASRVGRYYLKVEKPVVNDPRDPFISFDVLESILGFDYAYGLFKRLVRFLENTDQYNSLAEEFGSFEDIPRERVSELYVDAYAVFDLNDIVAQLVSKGYDGAIYESNGDGSDTYEIRVFSPKNVRSAL